MAQDPQNQYYPDNTQPQNNNYNPQNYDPALVGQYNYSQGQTNTDQNSTYQYPVDTGMYPQPATQTYDPAQYYQPQPAVDPSYQYSQPQTGAYPIDNTQANYQAYPQSDVYSQNQQPSYQYEGMVPATTDNSQQLNNYNPISNTFEPNVQNYTSEMIDPNLSPVQDYNYNNPDFNTQPQSNQFSQDQYNNFDPNYSPEDQNNVSSAEPMHEGGFFSNKRNFIIIGLVVLTIGLISASGVLFYLKSQESTTNLVQNNQSSVATVPAPGAVVSTNPKTPASQPVTPSSQVGRAVAVGTTDTGGPGTPATSAKKTNLTKTPLEWVKAKFTAENLSDDGSCKVVSICGEKADYDNDGVTTIDEYNFQTDPLNPDTDSDGLSDGDEAKIYYSDPTKKDSDNDTFEDGDEITNCYDPITATKNKLSTARKSQITSITTTIPLHKATLDKLKKTNATNDDLDKGYIQVKCGATSSEVTNSSSSTSVKSSKNNI
jgi:hypothetical protein